MSSKKRNSKGRSKEPTDNEPELAETDESVDSQNSFDDTSSEDDALLSDETEHALEFLSVMEESEEEEEEEEEEEGEGEGGDDGRRPRKPGWRRKNFYDLVERIGGSGQAGTVVEREEEAADVYRRPREEPLAEEDAEGIVKKVVFEEVKGDRRLGELFAEWEGDNSGRYKNADAEFYESESDEELDGDANTVGSVPMEWYRHYDHIGYNIFGQKLLKSEEADRLDRFLSRSDDPAYWRTVRDEMNARDVQLSERELDMIRAMQRNRYPTGFNPYELPPEVDDPRIKLHGINPRLPPKSSFVPSLHEQKRVKQLIYALRRGTVYDPDLDVNPEEKLPQFYDLWKSNKHFRKAPNLSLTAPRVRWPGHAESYRPPEEFLFSKAERKKWEALDEEERYISFVPQRLERMRDLTLFERGIKERFERCLDLYLCPRTQKKKFFIPRSKLMPKLPKPEDLRPFPTALGVTFDGHRKRVRAVSAHASGQWVASGGDDKIVRVWEVMTGRCVKQIRFPHIVNGVAWCPDADAVVLGVISDKVLYLVHAGVGVPRQSANTDLMLTLRASAAANGSVVPWTVGDAQRALGVPHLCITHKAMIKQLVWHHKGDYCATVAPKSGPLSIVVHQLSGARSQAPFRKSSNDVQCVSFHRTLPHFVVATRQQVRVYHLVRQKLFKKLIPNARQVAHVDVHPRGDHIICATFDRRLCWFDLDFSTRPYKTLRYHSEAIRRAIFHPSYPLFATASDDATIHIFHCMTYDDFMRNALIVPLKILRAHKRHTDGLGVLDIEWHPTQPWLFSAGADGQVILWS